MNENRKLRGKVAMVFGGSRGIGAAIVQRLAADGADVALTYVSAANKAARIVETVETTGRKALAMKADSADAAAIQEAVAQAVDRFGRLDIIVVNAGILRLGSVETVSLEDLDRMLDVNVRGVFVAIQASAPRLTNGGRVITIGSNTAVRTGFPGSSVYSMTKAARGDHGEGDRARPRTARDHGQQCSAWAYRDGYDSRSPGDGEIAGSPWARWSTPRDRRPGGLSRERRICVHDRRQPDDRRRIRALSTWPASRSDAQTSTAPPSTTITWPVL